MKKVTGVCREFMHYKIVQQIPTYLSLPPKYLHRVKTQKTKPHISIDHLLKDLRLLMRMHVKTCSYKFIRIFWQQENVFHLSDLKYKLCFMLHKIPPVL